MHLGIYIPFIDERPAGLGVYMHEICSRLIEQFSRVTLFTSTSETVPSEWRESVEIASFGTRVGSIAGGALKRVHRFVWLNTILPIELKRRGIDVFFVPFHEGSLVPSVPQTVVVHDLTPLTCRSSYFNSLLVVYLRKILPYVLKRSRRVIAISENTKRDLTRFFTIEPGQISVVSEGFDTSTFYPRTDEEIATVRQTYGIEKPYLLYSGTYAGHKNVTLLPDILARCLDRGLDLQLVLCGRTDAGDFEVVHRKLRDYDLLDRTVLPGYVTWNELGALMGGATAFVFPSLYEGFGLAPLEAMACGAKVVCSNRASLPEVVGDGGILLDPDRTVEWVDAIERLAGDRGFSEQMRQAALARAEQFSWDDAAEEIAEIIQNLPTSSQSTSSESAPTMSASQ